MHRWFTYALIFPPMRVEAHCRTATRLVVRWCPRLILATSRRLLMRDVFARDRPCHDGLPALAFRGSEPARGGRDVPSPAAKRHFQASGTLRFPWISADTRTSFRMGPASWELPGHRLALLSICWGSDTKQRSPRPVAVRRSPLRHEYSGAVRMLAQPPTFEPALVHPRLAPSAPSHRDPDNLQRRGADHQSSSPRIVSSRYRAFAVSSGIEVGGSDGIGADLLGVMVAGLGGRGCLMPLPQPISHPALASK